MSDDGGEEIDPILEKLWVCVQGDGEIHADERGFRLGDDDLLPKDTVCECPWLVKDTETRELVLERVRLATLVLLVQNPPWDTWSQYMQASKRARVPAISLWSFKSAQRFFGLGSRSTPSPARANAHQNNRTPRSGATTLAAGNSPSSQSPRQTSHGSGVGGRDGDGDGGGSRRLFSEEESVYSNGGGDGDGESGAGMSGGGSGGHSVAYTRSTASMTASISASAHEEPWEYQREQQQEQQPVNEPHGPQQPSVPPFVTIRDSSSSSPSSSSASPLEDMLESPEHRPTAGRTVGSSGSSPLDATTTGSAAATTTTGSTAVESVGGGPGSSDADSSTPVTAAATDSSVTTSAAARAGNSSAPTDGAASGANDLGHAAPADPAETTAAAAAGAVRTVSPTPPSKEPAASPSGCPNETVTVAAESLCPAAAGGGAGAAEVVGFPSEPAEADRGNEALATAASPSPPTPPPPPPAPSTTPTGEETSALFTADASGNGSAEDVLSRLECEGEECRRPAPVRMSSMGVEMVDMVGSSHGGGDGDDQAVAGRGCSAGDRVGLRKDELAVARQGATRIGSLVETKSGHIGTVRFCGFTEFATGLWLGLELDTPAGKNDGSNQSTRYFTCPERHGLFVRPANVSLVAAAPSSASPGAAADDSTAAAAAASSAGTTAGGASAERREDRAKDNSSAVGRVGAEGEGTSEDARSTGGDSSSSSGSSIGIGDDGDGVADVASDGCGDGGRESRATTPPREPSSPRTPPTERKSRSPLAEVTEDRRHSVNSNPPDRPFSRSSSPVPASKQEAWKTHDLCFEGVKAGGLSLRSPPPTPPHTRNGPGSSPRFSPAGSPFPGRGRPASTIPSMAAPFLEKVATAESENTAAAVSKFGGAAPAIGSVATAAEADPGAEVENRCSDGGGVETGAAAASAEKSCNLGSFSSRSRQPPKQPETHAVAAKVDEATVAAPAPPAYPAPTHPASNYHAITYLAPAPAPAPAVVAGGEVAPVARPRGIGVDVSASLSVTPTKVIRKKKKLSGIKGSVPVMEAAEVAAMKKGAVAEAVAVMEAVLATKAQTGVALKKGSSFSTKVATTTPRLDVWRSAAGSSAGAGSIVRGAASAAVSTASCSKMGGSELDATAKLPQTEGSSNPAGIATTTCTSAACSGSTTSRTDSPIVGESAATGDCASAAAPGGDTLVPGSTVVTGLDSHSELSPQPLPTAPCDDASRRSSGGGGDTSDTAALDAGVADATDDHDVPEAGMAQSDTDDTAKEPVHQGEGLFGQAAECEREPTPVELEDAEHAADGVASGGIDPSPAPESPDGDDHAGVFARRPSTACSDGADRRSRGSSGDASEMTMFAAEGADAVDNGGPDAGAGYFGDFASDWDLSEALIMLFETENDATGTADTSRRSSASVELDDSAGVSAQEPPPAAHLDEAGGRSRPGSGDASGTSGRGDEAADVANGRDSDSEVGHAGRGWGVSEALLALSEAEDDAVEQGRQEEEDGAAEEFESETTESSPLGSEVEDVEDGRDSSEAEVALSEAEDEVVLSEAEEDGTDELGHQEAEAAREGERENGRGRASPMERSYRVRVIAAGGEGGGGGATRRGKRFAKRFATCCLGVMVTIAAVVVLAVGTAVVAAPPGAAVSTLDDAFKALGKTALDAAASLMPGDGEMAALHGVLRDTYRSFVTPGVGATNSDSSDRSSQKGSGGPQERPTPDRGGRGESRLFPVREEDNAAKSQPVLLELAAAESAERGSEVRGGDRGAGVTIRNGVFHDRDSPLPQEKGEVAGSKATETPRVASVSVFPASPRGSRETAAAATAGGGVAHLSAGAELDDENDLESKGGETISLKKQDPSLEVGADITAAMAPATAFYFVIEEDQGVATSEAVAAVVQAEDSVKVFSAPVTSDGWVRAAMARDESYGVASVSPLPWGALSHDVCPSGVGPLPKVSSAWVKKLDPKKWPQCSRTHAVPWRRNPSPVHRPPATTGAAGEAADSQTSGNSLTEDSTGKDVVGGERIAAAEVMDALPGEEYSVEIEEKLADTGGAAAPVRVGEDVGNGDIYSSKEEKDDAREIAPGGRVESESEESLPTFMRPDGGMVPVAFLTGCAAAKIAPGSSEGCESIPMLFGHAGKNVIELVRPGEDATAGKVIWRSRKSLIKAAKQYVRSKVSSWLRRKNKSPDRGASQPTPPKAIEGLYLRETPDRQLALLKKVSFNGAGGGGGGGERITDGQGQGLGRMGHDVEFGVILGGVSAAGVEGAVFGGGGLGGAGVGEEAELDGGNGEEEEEEEEEGRGTGHGEVDTGDPQEAESEEGYAVMLYPGGGLCVFETRGAVRCMSRGNHSWVTYVSEDKMP